MPVRACVCLLLVFVAPLWAQDAASSQPTSTEGDGSAAVAPLSSDSNDQMTTPTPVGEVGLPLSVAVETERKNYIRGGVSFQTAYDTNIFTQSTNVTGVDYSILPLIDLELTRSRTQVRLFYSPGFTLYQGYGDLNHTDHTLGFKLHYRLSPHLAVSLGESFRKAGYLQSLPDQNDITSTVGLIQKPNTSIIAPIAEQFSNFSTVEMTYQVGPNSMVGAQGAVSQLWYSHNRSLGTAGPQLYGVFDSGTQAAQGFYARRLSTRHYIGVNYGYQKLLAHPSVADTQAHSIVLFYTLYFPPRVSLSFFGGPQRSDTFTVAGPISSRLRMWSPQAGASFGYQVRRMSFTTSFARAVAEGGGLSSAVRSNSATASLRFLMAKRLSFGVAGEYATNETLNLPIVVANSGHTVLGTAFVQQRLGQHMGLHFGYSRLHQTYNIVAISNSPNQTRVEASISYEFERPLAR